MIQQKKKICKICQTEQFIFSKGRCRQCTIIENSKGAMKVVRKYITKQTDKNKLHRKSQSAIRNSYFEFHIDLCKVSEESGVSITAPTRANICHLFDKSRHPSLQGCLDNYVYLTLDEHTRFDKLLYDHEFKKLEVEYPNIWPEVVNRMENLLELCEEHTKFKIKFEEYLAQSKNKL